MKNQKKVVKKELPKEIKFSVTPKVGQKVMVFCGRDTYPDQKGYLPSRYGIVQHIILEEYKGAKKGIETVEVAYLKECPPIDTFSVDFFFPFERCYFVETNS